MATQTRRSQSKPSRRERRSVGTARSSVAPARRSYVGEATAVDYTTEYRFIRKDLVRILIWAGLLTIVMIALWFLPVL